MFYNGNMSYVVTHLSKQAMRPYSNLMYLLQTLNFDIKTKLQLFHRMIVTILTYCANILGVYNFTGIDKL